MDQPFIYKYRPINLKDFEIDSKIIELLETLVNSDILNLLLIGDSGCGKTSLINTIIKRYYSNNYDKNKISNLDNSYALSN